MYSIEIFTIRAAIHHREARLFLHFVGKLIIAYVDWHDLDRGINNEHQDRQVNDGFELARPPFEAAACRRVAISDAFRVH